MRRLHKDMKFFKKIYSGIKDFFSLSSWSKTTFFMLVIVVIFFFNLNFDAFLKAQQFTNVIGEGHVGHLVRLIFNPVVVNIVFDSPVIYTEESATLTWSSNASSCTGTNFNTGGASSGSVTLTPTSTTTYTINCDGVVASTTITVRRKPKFIEN